MSQKTLPAGTSEASWSALEFGAYDVSAHLILSGSDCPVPLEDFASVPLQVSPAEASRFLMQNFPPTDQVTLVGPHGSQTLVVPETGVVTLKPW